MRHFILAVMTIFLLVGCATASRPTNAVMTETPLTPDEKLERSFGKIDRAIAGITAGHSKEIEFREPDKIDCLLDLREFEGQVNAMIESADPFKE